MKSWIAWEIEKNPFEKLKIIPLGNWKRLRCFTWDVGKFGNNPIDMMENICWEIYVGKYMLGNIPL